jgi:serine/threonine protein kinase
MGDRTILTLSAPKLDDQISRETFKYEFVVPNDLPLAPVEIVGIGSFSTVCRSVVNIAGVQQACFAIKKLEGALRPLVVSNGAEGLAVDNSNASDSRTAMRGPDDREQKEQRLRDIVRVAREILILQTLSHPFVLKANRVWTHSFDVYLATPLLESDLGAVLDRNRRHQTLLSVRHVQYITFQLFSGLKYLHEEIGLVHRDLCPRNILIGDKCNILIADFGLARFVSRKSGSDGVRPSEVGSNRFAAPEVLLKLKSASHYSADLWAAGCILGELLQGGEPLFPDAGSVAGLVGGYGRMLGRPSEQVLEKFGDVLGARNTMSHATCDGLPAIKGIVTTYFQRVALQEGVCGQQKTLKNENAVGARVDVDPRTTQREDFQQILLGLVNYDFDSRLKASAVCCNFPSLRTLSTDWKLGAKLHEAKRSHDSEQRARLQDKMKMEVKVRKLSQKHDYLAAFDLVKNTILDQVELLPARIP